MKGLLFGAYYGIKDGYHAWKEDVDYKPHTDIWFEEIEDNILDEPVINEPVID